MFILLQHPLRSALRWQCEDSKSFLCHGWCNLRLVKTSQIRNSGAMFFERSGLGSTGAETYCSRDESCLGSGRRGRSARRAEDIRLVETQITG